MSTPSSAGRARSVYQFVKVRQDRYRVRTMCRVLGVAPSGSYKWLLQPVSNHAQEDARLLRLIRASFLAITKPNKAWVTDILYIRTWQGWLDVAVVMDLFSRKIVGWSAGPGIQGELVLNAVLMAVRRRHHTTP
jgi:putative transposase